MARQGHLAFDLVGGAGVLIQHATTTLTRCSPPPVSARLAQCFDTPASTFQTSPAFIGGFDVPVGLGAHAEVATILRIIALRRGALDTDAELRRSSFKAEIGVGVRGLW